MVRHYRVALLAGAFLAAAAVPARAEGDCQAKPATPGFCTVSVTEWVPETYKTTRTVYKTECRQETYTAYRCECVPETRTRTVTVCKAVPETRTEMRTVCVNVPCVEERTVMKKFTTCVPVTKTVTRCVDRGHWECREVPCGHRRKKCCDPCADCCQPTKTVKVWVPCKVLEQVQVTTYERRCELRPVTCKVTTCKKETRQEAFQVCCIRHVQEQKVETYTVHCMRQVPYQATRTVSVCVPHEETVTATRCVARTVQKQVPVACPATCCSSCKPLCCKPAKIKKCHSDCCAASSCCN